MTGAQSFTAMAIRDQFLPPVINAFQTLGLETRLVVPEEAIRDAYRESGKRLHPDAGGGEGEFAAVREAFAVISSPSRRLKHWLDLRGTPGDVRGTIDNALMDLFSEVGSITQQAEMVVRTREEAKSALVRAMLEGETQSCREAVERAIFKVEAAITEECSRFPAYENSEIPDIDAASKTARNLTFLEKWRTALRASFSRLV